MKRFFFSLIIITWKARGEIFLVLKRKNLFHSLFFIKGEIWWECKNTWTKGNQRWHPTSKRNYNTSWRLWGTISLRKWFSSWLQRRIVPSCSWIGKVLSSCVYVISWLWTTRNRNLKQESWDNSITNLHLDIYIYHADVLHVWGKFL